MNRIHIGETEAFVQERLAGEGTGHDWWHADRVRATSLSIQAVEGGNLDVVELAALLHDVGDRKVINAFEDDPTIAEAFLKSIGVDQKMIDEVIYVISNMSYSKSIGTVEIEKPLELQIVQDADRLDALGAIGIARAFAFGGSRGRPLYDPAASVQEHATSADYKNAETSTLLHFDEKLFRLKGTFNTARAEHIAQERDAYMHDFYNRFLVEWEGKA